MSYKFIQDLKKKVVISFLGSGTCGGDQDFLSLGGLSLFIQTVDQFTYLIYSHIVPFKKATPLEARLLNLFSFASVSVEQIPVPAERLGI